MDDDVCPRTALSGHHAGTMRSTLRPRFDTIKAAVAIAAILPAEGDVHMPQAGPTAVTNGSAVRINDGLRAAQPRHDPLRLGKGTARLLTQVRTLGSLYE